MEYSLARQAPKQYCSAISLQTYAVCQWVLASAWPAFHAGGTIRKSKPASVSTMVVALGIITTSSLKLPAGPSVQKHVSVRGPISHAQPHRCKACLLVGPFQEGRPGPGRTSNLWEANRGCFGKEKVWRGAVVKGKLASMRWTGGAKWDYESERRYH